MILSEFEKLPILAILRGIEKSHLDEVVQITIEAGIKAIEITLNTPNALELISDVKNKFASKISLGAGTVLSLQNAKDAVKAGALFLVAPNFNPEIAKFARDNNIPFFPGALTPGEIYSAWEAGAFMVKVFPAKFFGPKYFKEIKAPLDKVKLMAVSGVTPENISEYFSNGADAVAIGAGVYKKEWIENNEFDKISDLLRKYIKALPVK